MAGKFFRPFFLHHTSYLMEAIEDIGDVFKTNSEQIMRSVLSDPTLQAQMVDLNQSQLYDKGVDASGHPTGEYSNATIYGTVNFAGKIEKGQPYDHVTLKDSGASYDSMEVKVEDDGAEIKGNFPEAIKRGWPEALGLTDESIGEISEDVADGIVDEYLNNIEP